jgi:hypothetical protein
MTDIDSLALSGRQICVYDIDAGKIKVATGDWRNLLRNLANPNSEPFLKYKEKYSHLFNGEDIRFVTPLVDPIIDDAAKLQHAADMWDEKNVATAKDGQQ